MLTAIILFLFFFVILFDSLSLLKAYGARGKLVYFTLMLISLVVLTLHSLDFSVPSPAKGIKAVLDMLFEINAP